MRKLITPQVFRVEIELISGMTISAAVSDRDGICGILLARKKKRVARRHANGCFYLHTPHNGVAIYLDRQQPPRAEHNQLLRTQLNRKAISPPLGDYFSYVASQRVFVSFPIHGVVMCSCCCPLNTFSPSFI